MNQDPYKVKSQRPIISCGIILFCYDENIKEYKYLLTNRRNSFGFSDFIKGKYIETNAKHLQPIIDEMTVKEKNMIRNRTFKDIWCNHWNLSKNMKTSLEMSREYCRCENNFNKLKLNNKLDDYLNKSKTEWDSPEWEFPKGRMNPNESHLCCAFREFYEETGINKDVIHLIDNVLPFEEHFIGTNFKGYTYKYYLCQMSFIDYKKMKLDTFQKCEIGDMCWSTLGECLTKIRPYNLEKNKLIENIEKVLNQYCIYNNNI